MVSIPYVWVEFTLISIIFPVILSKKSNNYIVFMKFWIDRCNHDLIKEIFYPYGYTLKVLLAQDFNIM